MIYEIDIAQQIHRKMVIEVEASSAIEARHKAWEYIANDGELPKTGDDTELDTWVSGIGRLKDAK